MAPMVMVVWMDEIRRDAEDKFYAREMSRLLS